MNNFWSYIVMSQVASTLSKQARDAAINITKSGRFGKIAKRVANHPHFSFAAYELMIVVMTIAMHNNRAGRKAA